MPNITFRELEQRDLVDRVRWYNQKAVNRYLSLDLRQGTTLGKQQEWLDKYKKDNEKKIFVIEYDGKPIGNVGLVEISEVNSNAGLSIAIGETQFHGKGIGSKAIQFIADFAFNQLHLH